MSQIDDFLNDGPQPQGGSQTARKPDAVAKPKSQVDAFLADAPAPDRGLGGFARDAAAWAVKGAIAVPEAIVGLADIPTGGRVGKALENEGGTFGFRPKQAREIVNEWHSDATKEAQRKFQEAEGLGGKFQAAIENPSNIAGAVIESLPAMGAGGVIGRGALAATRLGQMGSKGAVVAGALGEGAVMAGSQAEGIRQETDDGLLTPGQAGAALATGAIGAGLGYAGGKLANKLGVGNAETMLAQGTKGLAKQHADEAVAAAANPLMVQAAKGIPRQVIEGALVEGVFEELPQSVTETIIQNLALDKPWSEGLDEAIVLGVLSGGAMGAGAAGYKGFTAPKADENKSNEAKQAADKAKQEQEARKADALQRVQQAWQQQAQLLAEQEAGEPEVPQTAPPDAAAMLAQQRAQEAQARQAEIDAGRAMASPDDEIYESTGTTMRPSEAMGLNPTAGGIEGAAALAVDTGASAAMQAAAQYIDPDDMPDAGADAPLSAASAVADTAPEDPFAGYERDYDELSDLEKELYDWEMTQREAPDEAFAALAELDDSDIPFFDRASNATDEDFLRALGASDEEIADALTTANQSASTQSHAASTAETQTNEPRSPRQSAGQGQEAKQVSQQLLPTDPAARIAELEAIAKDADAQARDWASRTYKHNPKPLPEHEAKGGPADVGEANEQRRLKAIADAKQRAAEARAEITRLQEQGNTQAQLAAKAPSVADLAAISRKQIPDMTDAELVALASATSPEHGRFKKLQKALQSRGLQAQAATNKGATENGTQASQTQQAGTQQQQAGAAVGQAIDSVPAGAAAQAAGQSTVTATQKTGNDGAQAAAQGEAVAKAIAQEGNARREAERQRKLEASERWTRMTAAERQAAAANAKGLNAIQKKNVHTKPWADLSDKVRAALLDVVVPQDAAQKVAQNSGQQTDSKEKEAKNDEKAVTELIEAGFDEVADWAQQELAHQEPVKENEIEVAASEAATHPDSNAPEPTQAQKEAGNYKKGHVRINGHDISIENPAGTSRRPEWPALKNHYGYFKGSVGADKDHVDVFLTDRADDASLPVFVVDQNNQDGSFDEHKVIMGAATEAEARQTYLQNYEKGWTGLGAITQMTQDEFKSWVYDPSKTKKPADLSAADLAAELLRAARAKMEAQSRTNDLKDQNNEHPEQAGSAANQGRTPEVSGGRGNAAQSGAAQADSADVAAKQSQDGSASADTGRTGGAGLRVPAADVAGAQAADKGGDASDRRTRTSGARTSDAGARSAGSVKKPETVSPANTGPGNFHIDNPLEIVGGGQVARFDKNKAAIELLNTIREAGRTATTEEQRILAGYTGWGSFGQELFQGTWAKPMPKQGWEERDRWLRDHLGQDEWESAQRSITNAHYTDPPTVMAMWDMAKRMGFTGGRVLEPSMGIGNFFGMMPLELKNRSQLAGIELDELTGSMAKLLYPDANIKVMGYQESKTPDNFYDLVIGNWPFENTVIADRRYNRLSPFLHDYFFLKALDQVRPGGLVIGITSNGSMDKRATNIRAALARKAELVSAIRLPSGAFQEYAGTKVVTDIVILKKREQPLSATPDDGWLRSVPYKTPSGPEVFINEYFVNNPDNIIGTTDWGHGTTRVQPGMIVHRPENMAQRLREAVALVPEGVMSKANHTKHISYVTNHTADREGSLTEQDGKLFVVRGEHLAPAQEVVKYAVKDAKKTAAREKQLRDLIAMRRLYAQLIEAEHAGDAEKQRTALRTAFEAFEKEHGVLGDSWGLEYLSRIDDPFYPALAALSVNGKPSAILSASTMRGAVKLTNPTPQDAYVLARNKSVSPTLKEIAQLAGKPEAEVKRALIESGAVFESPAGDIVPSDIYLSGNVRHKLREAQAALAEGNQAMGRNVAELKKVVPADIPYFNIESQLGATWVPAKVYADYIAYMLNRPNSNDIEVSFTNGRWKARLPAGANHSTEARTGFGTEHYKFSKLVNAALTNQTVKIKRKDSNGHEYVDFEATAEANARIGEIRSKFAEWLWSDPERRADLEAEYNETRNAYATPKFDGAFLSFEGMALQLGNSPFNLRKHQANAIWRALVNKRSINAHEVGTGKTFTMGGIAVESRRYGIAKKPLILAHNANSASVAHEIQMMYPAAKVLYVDNLSPATIAVKMRQIANDDWDAVVFPHSLIDRLSFREETLMEMAKEDIRSLEEEAYAAADEDGVKLDAKMLDDEEELKKLRSVTAKELVKARNRIIETIKKQAMRSSREGAVPFEELGIDMVLVDEVHEFKKPPISTRMQMKGLNTQTSDRSIALQFITRYVRANNFGGNVHTFTGTPITNTMTEIFHQMRYVMEDEMKEAGVDTWDGWFGSFAKEVQDVELSAAGEYEPVTRLASFINVPELRRMIGQYLDVVFASDMPEMQPRKVNGKTLTDPDLTEAERAELLNGRTEGAKDRPYKKVINVISDLTPQQKKIFAQIQGYARAWREMTGKQRKEAMAKGAPESPIITEGMANKASFDVRLVNDEALAGMEGKAPDDPGSKVSKVIENVLEIYHSDHRTAQVIFSDVGYSTSQKRSVGRNEAGEKAYKTVKTFSTMRDLVERLVQSGIPREQIAIVDGSTSKEKRKEIADAVNELRIRVVIGSTDTLGVGVNMQKNLRAMHHMDAPYMPGELEQRNGRGLRQGNQWNTVLEYRYMSDRLDGRRWQILAIKQRFITAFMKASGDTRVIEGDAVNDGENDILQSFSEAAGDPRILIREKLRKNVETLQRAERMHTNGVADARRSLRGIRENIEWSRGQLNQMLADKLPERLRNLMKQQSEDFRMVVRGVTYDSRADAEDAILKFFKEEMRMEHSGVPVGNYGELQVTARWPSLMSMPELVIEVQGQEFSGSLRGIEQQIRNFPHRIQKLEEGIAQREASIERLEQVAAAPFARAKDLDGAIKRLQDLERDIEQNPVPPPAWLRSGAPVDSEAYRNGQPFVVTGHRWTKEGWFVLGQDAKGNMAVPYTEVTDAQGMALYEEREFQAPEIVDKSAKSAEGVGTDEAGEVRAAAPQDDANFEGAAKRRPGTAQDKAVMQALADGKSARDVLRLIANQSKDPFRRQVAHLLLKAGITPNIQFGHIGKDKKGNPIHGQYRGKSDTILIAGSAEYAAERIFLHEAMHAATMRALAKPGLASQRLRALLAHVQKQPGAQGFYGTKNVDEFVAEVFTNPDFQRALRTMRAPSGSALKSAWDGFVRILRSILGLPRDADNVLSHALKLGVEAVRADMVLRRQGARAAGSVNAGADTIDQTQTEAFKRWFGDGGVRNADGEPQVFYHGGASDFTGIRFGGRFDGAIFVREGAESGYGEKQHALYLNSPILELDEMRDLLADNPQVLANVLGGNVAPDVLDMVAESLTDGSNYPDSKEVWDAIGAIDEADAQLETQKLRGRVARALGFKAVRTPDEFGGETVMVLDASAVKSAIGNNGNFDPEDPSILNFGTDDLGRIKASALDQIHKTLSHPGKVSLWDKTVGTMRHIAERYPAFKPVFDAAQQFLDDVASVANEAADMAPRLIPRVDTMRDMLKKPISVADNRAIGKALFSGTLDWGRDQHGKAMPMNELRAKYANLSVDTKSEILMASGKVQPQVIAMWRGKELAQYETLINNKFESTILKSGMRFSHEELRKFFNLNEQQISLYDEARATVDKSLDLTARAEMLRKLGRDWDFMRDMVMDAPTLTEAWKLLHEELEQRAKEIPDSRDQMAAKMFEIRSSFDKAQELMEHGYMPLQRFGKYTVDVVDENGERVYFSMFESKAESNKMAQAMRREYPNARVVQGTMNDQQFKLFAGITPETAELFGSMLGLDADGQDAKDQAFQEYLKLAKNNHSALKRLIHRKGIAGYSEDVGRVLASFVYSNARLAATGLNAGKMEQAINTLQTEHKEQGELGEIAAKLRSYIQDPQEEGHVIRGMLFAQYLGGSVASAAVNMTQPFAVTLPWLTQYGGMAAAGRYLAGALRDMAKRGHKYEADLAHALKMAEDDGVVSPQEIHQLMAQARGAGGLRTGDGTKLGDARAQAANLWEKVKVGWGQPFALAEQFNRRSTFIAAYRLAKNRKLGNPAEFARRAVLETQFLYSKANKPQWARGAVGGTLFTFKTYSVSFLELMHRMWTQGGPEGKRAVGWAMAMLLLMGGAGGLPFMEDLEDLIDGAGQMMGYNVSAKQWRQQLLRDVLGAELAGFIEQGMSGLPGAPVDVSGRLGMGNLIPGTGLLLDKQSNARDVVELLGPAGDLVQRGMQAVKSVASGVVNADPTSIGRGVMEVMPTAVRNAAKGVDMASSGIYKDTKGYKVIDTTLDEAVAKFLGFQPRSVAEVQEANSFMQRAKSFYIQTSNEIKAQWAKALFEKDAAGVERARQRVKEWNEKNPDQPIRVNMRAIWERVRQMGKDRTARIADTAPKALRQQLRDMAQEQSR